MKLKKILSLFLAVAVSAGCFNVSVLAEESTEGTTDSVAGFADYEPGDMPENIIINPSDINGFLSNNGTAGVFSYPNDHSSMTWVEATKAIGFYRAGPTVMSCNVNSAGAGSYINDTIVAGNKYVLSANLKNSAPDVKESIDFALALYGNDPILKFPVTNTEYQVFKKNFEAPRDSSLIAFGLDGSIDRSAYTADQMGSLTIDLTNELLYVAEEVPFDMTLSLDKNKVEIGKSVNVDAVLLNQIGIESTYSQEFQWAVVSEDRTTAIEDGFTITETEDGANILVADTVPTGNYVAFATSTANSEIKKGIEFTVIDAITYEDYEQGAKPANMFVRPTNISSFTGHNGHTGVRLDYVAGDKFIPLKEKNDEPYLYSGAGPISVSGSNNVTGGLTAGKNYALSVTMKNLTPEIRAEQVFGFSTGGTYNPPVSIPFTNTEYETYNIVFTALADSQSFVFGFDATIDRSGYSEDELGTIHISMESGSELYIAEEEAYQLNVTVDEAYIEVGKSVNAEAELLNQVGIEGNLSQEFQWAVVSEDRTTVIEDGFTITETENGVNVAIDDTVTPGNYVIFAISNDYQTFKKGATITVIEEINYDDYEPAEITDNIVITPSSVNSFTPNNGAAGTYTFPDDQSYFTWVEAAKAIGYYRAGPTVMASIVNQSGVGPYLYKSIESGKKYVFSARLKNSSPEVKESIDFALALYGGDPVFKFPVTNTEFETFNVLFEAPKNSVSISIGLDGSIDRSAYTADQLGSLSIDLTGGGSLYVAEEAAYNIKNTFIGEDEIIPGGTTTIKSEILNQIGLKYEANQNIEWTAMNEDCTAEVEDITITPQGDGVVLVETADDIAYGTYKIVARSPDYGWVRKSTLYVLDSVDERISEMSVVKLGNEIVLNAKVKDTDHENIYFRLAEYNGDTLAQVKTTPIVPVNTDAEGRVSLTGVGDGNNIKVLIWGDDMKPIDNLYDYQTEYNVSDLDSLYGDDQAIDMFEAPVVSKFFNNKNAAVSVTFDDGNYSAAVYYDSLFQQYNMRGTAMVVSDWLKDTTSWQNLLDKGTIDLGNHSKAHAIKYGVDEYTQEELETDITGAYEDLHERFPNEKLIVYATPWCQYSDDAGEEILKNHFANRTGGSGFLTAYPTDAQMMKIPSYIVQSDQTVETLNGNIDKAIEDGSWYSLLMHGVNEEAPEEKNNNINKDVCAAHFRYIGSKADVWAGSMTDVIQYIKERDTATITVNWIRENAMSLTLTDTLDNSRFDFPLTYKVNVPSHWETVTVTQNYESVEVVAETENDKNYVYINIVPDKGDITLESIN